MTLARRIVYGGLFGDEILGVSVPKRETDLMLCPWTQAAKIIRANHYSGTTAAMRSVINLVVLYRGEVHGALMLGYGMNPAKNGTLTGDRIEFDRMWLSDVMPHCSETVVIGALHTLLRKKYPHLRYVQSWSDTGEGNPGTIYKAANYRYVKQSPGNFWRNEDGRKVHAVTLWHWYGEGKEGGGVSNKRLRSLGWERIQAPQLLFEYRLA